MENLIYFRDIIGAVFISILFKYFWYIVALVVIVVIISKKFKLNSNKNISPIRVIVFVILGIILVSIVSIYYLINDAYNVIHH